MGKTKLAYVLKFGIAPHFRSILISDVKLSPFFSISFDESLNGSFQNCQMDIITHFSNENLNQASTRYFDSKFIGYPTARNLKSLNCSVEDVSHKISLNLLWMAPEQTGHCMIFFATKEKRMRTLL